MPLQFVRTVSKDGPFWSFVKQQHINIIILDPLLLADPQYRDDPEFQALVLGTRTEDFQLFAVRGYPAWIAVRRDLVAANGRPVDVVEASTDRFTKEYRETLARELSRRNGSAGAATP